MRVAAWTQVGLVRSHNEDAIALPGVVLTGSPHHVLTNDLPADRATLTLAVIDGMGGHAGGVEASRLIALRFAEEPGGIPAALNDANDAVYDEMERRPELAAMGATIAGIQVVGREATIFNVGDARVYLHSGGYSTVASVDDRSDGPNNLITQSIGGTTTRSRLDPHITLLSLDQPVRFMLCTDGLSEYVRHEDIQDALDTIDPVAATEQLVQLAFQAGAPDNVSVVVADWPPSIDSSP